MDAPAAGGATAAGGDAAAAAPAEDIVQEEVVTGVLWKRGESGTVGSGSWKQRFVVLAGGKLSYYTTQVRTRAERGGAVVWVGALGQRGCVLIAPVSPLTQHSSLPRTPLSPPPRRRRTTRASRRLRATASR